jgi:hypothetical protein
MAPGAVGGARCELREWAALALEVRSSSEANTSRCEHFAEQCQSAVELRSGNRAQATQQSLATGTASRWT